VTFPGFVPWVTKRKAYLNAESVGETRFEMLVNAFSVAVLVGGLPKVYTLGKQKNSVPER